METLKTRFNNIKYEHFKVNFKGLIIDVRLLDDKATSPNQEEIKDFCEEFKISITNKDKTISYKFYNSIMEREISDIIKLYNKDLNFSQMRQHLKQKPLKMWAGYDKIKSFKELNRERAFHLLYSVLNCLSLDKNTETESFKFFCHEFGYDEDSIKAERIYKAVQELKAKIYDLRLTEGQERYLDEEVNQETDKFKQDVYKAIDTAI